MTANQHTPVRLTESDDKGMIRNSSSRFHVDRVQSVDIDDGKIDENQPLNPNGTKQNGRFEVTSSSRPSPETEAAPIGAKSVHFSVGSDEPIAGESPSDEHKSSISMEYNTQNIKSFRNVETLERVPHIDHYRNIMSIEGAILSRPTLAQLHEDKADVAVDMHDIASDGPSDSSGDTKLETYKPPETPSRVKFGWIKGVFVRCILNILGVMLYLRISWVAGQAGIALGSVIILLSAVVTTITSISMCAISTNGEIKGGGAYFMISRSLGPEFGGSIGLIFAFANAVGAAMYIVGFSETVRDLMKESGSQIIDGGMNDIRIVGLGTCLILMAVCFIGVSFESKMQVGLLGILIISIVNYFVGSFFPVSYEQQVKGVTGFSAGTVAENFLPHFRDGETFFSVFSVFFPAATGIMAGANISGDLADPQRSIPKGTLLAILITTVIYLGGVWFTGATCIRDASGLYDMIKPLNDSIEWNGPACLSNNTCNYGLMNYFQVMELESAWGPLITAGIFAATLSSALASLVSAPKVFQAVCKDRLFPYIHVFAKGYGKADEPRRGYALCFTIALLMILIGDLNAIAPIISNFFLASYALINYSCFDASFAESPGFRPGFKYYNMWLSLAGAILCVAVMFVISWETALISFGFISVLYFYVHYRKPDVNWGSSAQAHSYKSALHSMLKLSATEEHVKNYRPQFLVMTGNPVARASLVDFVANITKDNSLMICGHVVPYLPTDRVVTSIQKMARQITHWLEKRRVRAFYCPVANPSLRAGAQTLQQLAGLGKLKPNIVLLGFKNDYRDSSIEKIEDYFGVIHDAFDSNLACGVLRLPNGLDFSEMMKEHGVGDTQNLKLPDPSLQHTRADLSTSNSTTFQNRIDSTIGMNNLTAKKSLGIKDRSESASSFAEKFPILVEKNPESDDEQQTTDGSPRDTSASSTVDQRTAPPSPTKLLAFRSRQMSAIQKDILASINQFQRKIKKAVIDVWWLFDDGGLTLLLPHLLTSHKSYLEGAKLRVFTIASSKGAMETEQRNMGAMLSKFRINFSDVFVIPDIARKPSPTTIREFEETIAGFREDADPSSEHKGRIRDVELMSLKDKTYRQLRTRELLLHHSADASLIILTMPIPRKGACSSSLYLAWLDMLTRDLPPILLLRGNQQSVLTFYS